jgi:hypothetical protein
LKIQTYHVPYHRTAAQIPSRQAKNPLPTLHGPPPKTSTRHRKKSAQARNNPAQKIPNLHVHVRKQGQASPTNRQTGQQPRTRDDPTQGANRADHRAPTPVDAVQTLQGQARHVRNTPPSQMGFAEICRYATCDRRTVTNTTTDQA